MSSVHREDIVRVIERNGRERKALIHILQDVQSLYNYLPAEALKLVSELSAITPSEITAVATFYSKFRLKVSGKHTIRICTGTACYVKGGEKVYLAFRDYLKLAEGEDTTKDGLFTLEKVACLGCCMLAVAVQVDDIIYGWVEPDKVNEVLEDFLNSQYTGKESQCAQQGATQGEARICLCSSCMAAGADKVYAELKNSAAKYGLPVKAQEVGCDGVSYRSPFLSITDRNKQVFQYANIEAENVNAILLHHFKPDTLVKKFFSFLNVAAYKIIGDRKGIYRHRINESMKQDDAAYIDSQVRIATEGCAQMNPNRIDEYLANDGFAAYEKVTSMEGADVIEEIVKSGLRGRGGGGFPTGIKWRSIAGQAVKQRYVICNADEGDPGAFMDRMLLESFPYRVLEGMMIAMHAVGAQEAFVYIRNEYPLAVKRINQAIEDIKAKGYPLNMHVMRGAGAFVCGEETALLASLDGKRGMPEFKPPFPTECGYNDSPTLINNVETFALIPWIIRNGAAAFAAYGTEGSKGTKTFALAGNIKRGGLIEAPIGMTLRSIINDIGGGVPEGRKLKAVQIGGPSGGCVPEQLCDLQVDYESLSQAGAIMGSGGVVVLDDSNCMVDIARYFLEFTTDESCGKCSCCRVGTTKMLEILNRMCEGKGKKGDIEKLEELAKLVNAGSICGLGKTAPNPVLSTLKFFREEYEAHLEGRCPAGKCKALVTYSIEPDKCIGCGKCARACANEAIAFTPWQPHSIDIDKCDKCKACIAICPTSAITIHS